MFRYDILDKERRAILPLLSFLKEQYYLAGGTALALQLGHRDSVDFDFFTPHPFDTQALFTQFIGVFGEERLTRIQEAPNTLGLVLDGRIQISCMTYPYPLIEEVREDEYLKVADLRDIGCMKLSAITSRSVRKDFVDLYVLLQQLSLHQLLMDVGQKLPSLDRNLILKSLAYFDDITEEPILFKQGHEVTTDEMERFLLEQVRQEISGH